MAVWMQEMFGFEVLSPRKSCKAEGLRCLLFHRRLAWTAKGQFMAGALSVRQRGGDGVRGSRIEVFCCDGVVMYTKADRSD
jgi:hypothetical protein